MISGVFKKNRRFHFIGIGGVSMSGLARFCLKAGCRVSGSDTVVSDYTGRLAESGVKIFIGHARKNVRGAEVVIYNSAIAEDNPELCAARDNGKLILKRSELLGEILSLYSRRICVAGCHGKTTVTAMLTQIFRYAGEDPAYFIGGNALDFGNAGVSFSGTAIAEACEFRRNFLDLNPNFAVITNIDDDHMDCYRDLADLTDSYRRFGENALCFINADDKNARSVRKPGDITYGIKSNADYRALHVSSRQERYSFDFMRGSECAAPIWLNVVGEYNVANALAAAAAADRLGVPPETIARALRDFRGVERRNEFLGEWCGAECYADYAHHPREIAASLETFHKLAGEKLVVVFQPHTYSRTRLLFGEFLEVLQKEPRLILYASYAAREPYDVAGSAYTLKRALPAAEYADTPERLADKLQEMLRADDKLLILGAGDLYEIVKKRRKEKKPL